MSKINLGSVVLNKKPDSVNDFIILSDVVNTSMSYCTPKLIRSVEDLNLYFGIKFKSRNYYIELLSKGITLYLYRPTLSERTPLITSLYGNSLENYSEDYIDYYNYEKIYKGYNKFEVESIGISGNLYYGPLPGYWIYKDSSFIEIQEKDLDNYSDFTKSYIDDSTTFFPIPEDAEEECLYIRESQCFWTIDEDDNLIKLESSEGDYTNRYYNGFFEDELPEKGKSGYLYLKNIDSSNGPWVWTQEKDDLENEYGEFVEIDYLDQNLSKEKYLESYYNRDSLRLFDQYDKDYVENTLESLKTSLETLKSIEEPSEKEVYQIKSIEESITELDTKYKIKDNLILPNPKYLEYTRPRYDNQYFNYEDPDNLLYNELDTVDSKLEDIEDDYSYASISIKIPDGSLILKNPSDYTNSEENDIQEYPYILITLRENNLENDYLFWFFPGTDSEAANFTNPLGSDYLTVGKYRQIALLDNDGNPKTNKELFNELCDNIKSVDSSAHIGYRFIRDGEYIDNDSSEDVDGCYIELYTNSICFIRYFSTIPGSTISPNYQRTFDILSIISNNHKRIDFFSKSSGQSPDLDGNINIKLEKLNSDEKDGWYSIEISRYNYSEYFEGSIFPLDEYQNRSYYRLDNIINSRSKIIECKLHLFRSNGTLYKPEDHDSLLTEGEWELKRSYIEDYETKDFWNSLEIFHKSNVNEDFLLVPDIKCYTGSYIPNNYTEDFNGYYSVYNKFFYYAVSKNCQILIENKISPYVNYEITKEIEEINKSYNDNVSKYLILYKSTDSGNIYYQKNSDNTAYEEIDFSNVEDYWKIKNDNTEFNYIKDSDNYLVYFYGNIYINGQYRPGYYIFINGIITGNFLQKITSNNILYYPPLNEKYLLNYSDNSFREKLETRKSNYLVSNNYYYYYDKLLNGKDASMSITSRFLVSKVSREFERRKFEIIGKNTKLEAEKSSKGILEDLYNSFSHLIKYTSLDNVLLIDNYAFIMITMIVSEFIDKDIKINITLNY